MQPAMILRICLVCADRQEYFYKCQVCQVFLRKRKYNNNYIGSLVISSTYYPLNKSSSSMIMASTGLYIKHPTAIIWL